MKLEDQVVSLELAKKLKELGVKQESLFHWTETHIPYIEWVVKYNPQGLFQTLSAFTVAELGEMLPNIVQTGDTLSQPVTGKSNNKPGYGCSLIDANRVTTHSLHQAETEADARAKMLIYLIENNLITI